MPSTIEQIQQDVKARPDGLAILAVSIREPRATVERWVEQHLTSSLVLLDPDGAATAAYGVTATPTVFLVARDGTLRGKAVGNRPWTSRTGRALLEALGKS